ncbi:MAG: hypothetical protein JXQ29_06540 [Planctomycetes bacterium]|nr:hypothetical protein [Planctomycetota bacterium]
MRIGLPVFCLVFLAGAVTADEVYVPDNLPASGSGNYIPMSGSYMQTDGRYQVLYSAALLGTKPYLITDMAFAPAWTGDLKTTQFQVRISHYTGGTLSSLMDANIPSPVTVFDGPLTWVATINTWCPIGFTGSFRWNGRNDIVVDLRYKGGVNSGSGLTGTCRTAAIPRNWALGNYAATVRSGGDSLAGLKARFTVVTGPKQGDLVMCELGSGAGGGLFYKTWPHGSVTTFGPKLTLGTVKVAHSNSFVYASGANTGSIYQIDGSGTCVTLTTVSTNVSGIGVDQDGTHVVANYSNNTLYRLSGASCWAWTTLPTTYGGPNALCRDGNTGDWIVGTFGGSPSSALLRVHRQTGGALVLCTLPSGVCGVDWVPQTGEYVVARGNRISFLRSDGTERYYLAASRTFNCVTADHKTGDVFAGTIDGHVYWWTYSGSYVGWNLVRSGANISGIDVWDDQNVSMALYGSGSTTYARATLRFNDSPGRTYYAAVALSPTSGVNLGAAGWVNLRPDGLFYLTAAGGCPYFTQGFSGVLDSSGTAYARFKMPYNVTRVYVSAVAVNVAKPGNMDVGNVEVVSNW